MMRINRKALEQKCADTARILAIPFELNYSAEYGGYCLESNGGRFRHSPRIPAKEMWWFLAGLIEAEYLRTRNYGKDEG